MSFVAALALSAIATLDGIFPGNGEDYYLGVAKSAVVEIRSKSTATIGKIYPGGAFVGTDNRHLPLLTMEQSFRSLIPYDTQPFLVKDPYIFRDFSRRILGVWSGVIFTQRGKLVSIEYKSNADQGDGVRSIEFSSEMQPFQPRVNKERTMSLVCLAFPSEVMKREKGAFKIGVTDFTKNKTQLYQLALPHARVLQAEFIDSEHIALLASEEIPLERQSNQSVKADLYSYSLSNTALTHIQAIAIRNRSGYLARIGSTLVVLGVNGIVKIGLKDISVQNSKAGVSHH